MYSDRVTVYSDCVTVNSDCVIVYSDRVTVYSDCVTVYSDYMLHSTVLVAALSSKFRKKVTMFKYKLQLCLLRAP